MSHQVGAIDHQLAFYLADNLTGALTILGCLSNMVICFLTGDSQKPLGKMVFGLSIMDLVFNSFAIFLQIKLTFEVFCQSFIAVANFGLVGSMCLTCCFGHALYHAIETKRMEVQEAPVKRYFIVSIACGIIFASLRIIGRTNQIDERGICVINHQMPLWALVNYWIIPQSVSSLYCLLCYLLIIFKLKELGARYYIELLFYPFVLIVCYLPFSCIHTYSQISGKSASFGWNMLTRILFGCQGIFNALIYGLSRRIVNELKNRYCSKKRTSSSIDIGLHAVYNEESAEKVIASETYESLLSDGSRTSVK